jgi:hypothetical protein
VQWHEWYNERFKLNKVEDVKEEPPHSLNLPNKIRQTLIFITRDTLSKLSNKQYLLINMLEAPLLAFILAFIIKYKSAPGGKEYLFRFNDNFPAFILMSIVVALFMGLTVSAEEIIRDRKILKRESFLNLSWNSYLMSKITILFTLSAIQTLSFVLIGHLILEVEWRMILPFWLVLFSVSCMANVLGLNISSAFNSAVTVYVLIPLLLIPQMILSGLLFRFDKLNNLISTKGKVPLIADFMASRWAFEALAVYNFINNSYEKPYYSYEKIESQADFRASFLADELEKKRKGIADNIESANDSIRRQLASDLEIIRKTLKNDYFKRGLEQVNLNEPWSLEIFTPSFSKLLEEYLLAYRRFYQEAYNKAVAYREQIIYKKENEQGSTYKLNEFKNQYYNESLADLVKNVSTKNRILEYRGELIQEINPIFLDPQPAGFFNYRTHFFAPKKNFVGIAFSTYSFNLLVIWAMALLFYLTLYFELLRKFVDLFGKVNLPMKK